MRNEWEAGKREKVRDPQFPHLFSLALPDYFREATNISSVAGTF
jgi:hypothetical protein